MIAVELNFVDSLSLKPIVSVTVLDVRHIGDALVVLRSMPGWKAGEATTFRYKQVGQ